MIRDGWASPPRCCSRTAAATGHRPAHRRVRAAGGDEYYAGSGGRAYMVEKPGGGTFAEHGLSAAPGPTTCPSSGGLRLSLLFDLEDPLPTIMNHS
ncbi:hypothetical protein QJS66_01810 [Kocuria rhizophila]|nr:hypothetical protein QJS66_01810 [Kocuria rhizophila]